MQARFAQSLLAAALAVALASPACAQAQRMQPNAPATAADAPSRTPTRATGPEMRMSKLIGTHVVDPSGKALGEVKDVVVDTNTGAIEEVAANTPKIDVTCVALK